jgi:hypothetical protein
MSIKDGGPCWNKRTGRKKRSLRAVEAMYLAGVWHMGQYRCPECKHWHLCTLDNDGNEGNE